VDRGHLRTVPSRSRFGLPIRITAIWNGVTTFKFVEDSSCEDILLNELDAIDDHHGTYSANPPYTIIEVIGTGIGDTVKAKLAEFGFDQFEPTLQGFRAIRPLPKDWSPDRWR